MQMDPESDSEDDAYGFGISEASVSWTFYCFSSFLSPRRQISFWYDSSSFLSNDSQKDKENIIKIEPFQITSVLGLNQQQK